MEGVRSELIELEVPGESRAVGKQIVELDLPEGALIVLIHRNGQYLIPNGATILAAGDIGLVLVDPQSLGRVREILGGEHAPTASP